MCLGLLGLVFVVLEIINLQKAAAMTAADYPNLTPEQLESKRSKMRLSAWWLLGGAIWLIVVGNLLLLAAAASQSQEGVTTAYVIGIGGFVVSLVISAIHGSAAARLR